MTTVIGLNNDPLVPFQRGQVIFARWYSAQSAIAGGGQPLWDGVKEGGLGSIKEPQLVSETEGVG